MFFFDFEEDPFVSLRFIFVFLTDFLFYTLKKVARPIHGYGLGFEVYICLFLTDFEEAFLFYTLKKVARPIHGYGLGFEVYICFFD